MNIIIVAGARPNFMKIAPIIHAIDQFPNGRLTYSLVHTGQHFDEKMSQTFFKELNIPEPDVNLECGGGTQAEQTAAILINFEKYLMNSAADLVLVVGDVTSTMACTLVAKKLNVKVAHVEAGIRSGDISMPEEINRIVTDSIADYFFTTTIEAKENLIKAGTSKDNIFFVGNTMIDTLLSNRKKLQKPSFFDLEGLIPQKYLVLTLHRPSNVDDIEKLELILNAIIDNSQESTIVFPVHPRTRKNINFQKFKERIIFTEPIGYLEFNYLVMHSLAVITDSGGITEETTVMGIPCITLRDSTERPETINIGTNELIGTNPKAIEPALKKLYSGNWKKGAIPEKWDGKTASRIVEILNNLM
jgi:UDP-N-acetylglucosamine 2-epimerase (non-hydrolysing)